MTTDDREIENAAQWALQPFDRGAQGENPYQIQYKLQESMQALVGIVRTGGEMQEALEIVGQLNARADRAGVAGHRQYNNGWHTALDLRNMLTRLRSHHTRRAAARGKPRRTIPRRLSR